MFPDDVPEVKIKKRGFDRVAYQREYMKKRRKNERDLKAKRDSTWRS